MPCYTTELCHIARAGLVIRIMAGWAYYTGLQVSTCRLDECTRLFIVVLDRFFNLNNAFSVIKMGLEAGTKPPGACVYNKTTIPSCAQH